MKKLMLGAVGSLFVLSACSEGPVAPAPEAEAPTRAAYPSLPGNPVDLGLRHHTRPSADGDRFLALHGSGTVLNGSFEDNGGAGTGALFDWSTDNDGFGEIQAHTASSNPSMPAPPDGEFAAIFLPTGPSTHILYQDVVVPAGGSELHLQLYIENLVGTFITPESLESDIFAGAPPNQQFRVDIMDPAAPLDDVGSGVLANVYRTEVGDAPVTDGYISVVYEDLELFAGQTVRLRFALATNIGPIFIGVDHVAIPTSNDPTTRADCMKGGWEDYGFRNQGQCVRFVETGKDRR